MSDTVIRQYGYGDYGVYMRQLSTMIVVCTILGLISSMYKNSIYSVHTYDIDIDSTVHIPHDSS